MSCKVFAVGDGKGDEAKLAIDALASCLTKITNLPICSIAAPASMVASPGDLDGLNLDSITTPVQVTPHKSNPCGRQYPDQGHSTE